MMLSIKRSTVPVYLRESDFYKSLSEEDDEEITIPTCNMKPNTKVASTADLVHMLSTARFWGLTELPEPAMRYAMHSCDQDAFSQLEQFEDIVKTVECLKAIRFAEGVELKICRAAEFGRIDFIRYLAKKNNALRPEAGSRAAANGQLACLEYITSVLEVKEDSPYEQISLLSLPATASVDCLKHLHDHGATLGKNASTIAASTGNLSYLKFLHNYEGLTKPTMTAAITNGHLPCVAFIHEEGKVALEVGHAYAAALNQHLDCLKYLFEHGCPRANRVCNAAAQAGHVDCLMYAHEQGCKMSKTTMMSTKNLNCIKYMREKKVKWDHSIYNFALQESRLDCLQYFHDQGLSCGGVLDHAVACTADGESLRFLYEHGAAVQQRSVREYILVRNNLTCLKLALDHGYLPEAADCAITAQYGALQCLQHLRSVGCPWDASTSTAAARHGKVQLLRFAVENGCPTDEETMEAAAACLGTVESMQILHKAGCPWDLRTTRAAASSEYHGLKKLKYAHKNGCPWDESIFIKIAEVGNIDVVKYAHQNGCPWSADTFVAAVDHGTHMYRMTVVKYLHEKGCPWDSRVCTIAAGRGFIDMLKYLHERGCPWTVEACNAAASRTRHTKYYSSENMRCLKYLHENGCPWDVTTSNAAASAGWTDSLKYLHKQGCPCDETTCAAAASTCYGCACLAYLHRSGVPWDSTTCSAAAADIYSANLVYAHGHGCPWSDDICTIAARAKSYACLQYAHAQGCKWDHLTYMAAVESGEPYILQYLNEQGCPKTAEETAAIAEQKAMLSTAAVEGDGEFEVTVAVKEEVAVGFHTDHNSTNMGVSETEGVGPSAKRCRCSD